MKDLIDKLTTYNIFNYLFPGVLFVVLAKATTDYNFIQENNFLGAFLYYFIGMTISRFGSVVIEPILRKINFVKFRDYQEYAKASKQDLKIELLSEVNNTYRTLNSMLIILLLLKLYRICSLRFEISNTLSFVVLAAIITVLYLFSYRKQTSYISKRIDANNQL